jgi:ATP-dependent DNA helicase Rep
VLNDWLKDIGYEKHLYDGEESEKIAAARWNNVMDFCDWMAQRCGGQIDDTSGAGPSQAANAPVGGSDVHDVTNVGVKARGAIVASESKTMLEVVQTIALLSTISEREGDQNVVTLSTLHAAKGLEWPHVVLAGVNEGLLPFKLDNDDGQDAAKTESIAQRLQEERRLMYVGITRAQHTLTVSWLRRRKKGRETVAGVPSRFIAEMDLNKTTIKEDPREKIRALRAEFAKRAADSAQAQLLAETTRDAIYPSTP